MHASVYRHTVQCTVRVETLTSVDYMCPLWMATLELEKKFNQFEHHSHLQLYQIYV